MYLEAQFKILVLLKEGSIVHDSLRSRNSELEDPFVNLFRLLKCADTLDDINVETPHLPTLVNPLLRCQSFVKIIHRALVRLSGLCHNPERLVEIVIT